ncbi:uncharacterized protein LOC142532309 [Primulina tabacum]|uniref:uncharacterized protein LOC142532309 n=1 Tax=Primulina tabacum TaxID=48773 RepID=UPI003F5A1F45
MAPIASLGKHHHELATKFLAKYFPPGKSAQLKIEICTLRQTDLEQLYEAWYRYKELLRKCPNHGFEDWVQIELFYNGLNGQTRGTVDAAPGGTIFAKSPAQAYDLLEQMTINSYHWPSERSGVKRAVEVYAVDPITSLTAQVSALTTQLAAMNKVSIAETKSPLMVAEEPSLPEEVQYINNKNFGGYGGYRGKPSFEDLVGTFVVESGNRTESRLDNLETHMASIGATLKILESQVGQIKKQLTSQPSGAVQKTAEPNLREVNAIFIHHEETCVVCRKEKEVELTLVRDEKLSPTKGARGASINIMPRSLYEKLGLSKMRSTELSVQLADKSVKVPLGIVDDVELKIDKLEVLAEFLVLDMENSQDVHVILGRPLLAAVGAMIDVKRGKLTMEVESQLVEIRVSKKSYDTP